MGTTGRSLCAAAGSIVCCLRQPTYIICHRSPPHEYGTTHRSRWLPRTTGLAQPADRHPQARRALPIRGLNPPRSERSLPHARFRTAYQTLRLRSPTIAVQIEQSQDIYARSREATPCCQGMGLIPIGTAPGAMDITRGHKRSIAGARKSWIRVVYLLHWCRATQVPLGYCAAEGTRRHTGAFDD